VQGGGGRRPTSGPLGASKKAPEVRRRELLGGGGGSLAAALAELCEQRAAALLRSQHGSEVLVEACCGGQGGLLADCLQGGPALAAVHDALVAAVADGSAGPATGEAGGQEAGEEEPALSHFFGSRALRRLVLASTCDDAPAAAAAAEIVGKLWRGALRGRCAPWVHTHAAKVLAALLKCGEPSVRAEAAKELAAAVPGSLDDWAAKLTGGGEKGPAAQGHSQSAGKKPKNKQKA
jgi:pumilio family protein 6